MDFRAAAQTLLRGGTREELAAVLGLSVPQVRRTLLNEAIDGHRAPPPGWQERLAAVARERSREYTDLAVALEAAVNDTVPPGGTVGPQPASPASPQHSGLTVARDQGPPPNPTIEGVPITEIDAWRDAHPDAVRLLEAEIRGRLKHDPTIASFGDAAREKWAAAERRRAIAAVIRQAGRGD